MYKCIATLLLLLCAVTSNLTAYALQYEHRPVREIQLELMTKTQGDQIDEQTILSRLKTKIGGPFTESDFDADLKLLAQDYHRIDPAVKSIDDGLSITLKLWPKPIVRTITWNGNEKVKTGRLESELGVKPEHIFDRQLFGQSFRKLQAYYVKNGFFEAELRYEVTPDSSTNDVDIEIFIDEGRSGRIAKIEFSGFTKEEETELASMVLTKKHNFLMSWMTGAGTYHDDMAQQDRMIVLNYLQNQGFADAKVSIDIEETGRRNRVILRFTAERGKHYRAGKLTFEGNKLFTSDEISALFAIRKGDSFSPEKIRQTSQSIQNLYGKQGYIDTFVNYEPTLDPDEPVYSVHFRIEEGNQYRVGLIKIFGNQSTNNTVILHETLITPGDVFNTEKLRYTEERLHNIGYFEHVNVYAVVAQELSDVGANFRDVHIEVEEKSTGTFGFQFGFSTSELFYGGLNITERNFNWRGIPDVWNDGYKALRGGGEYAHMRVNLGQRARSYVLSWTKPYFYDTEWVVGFDVEHSENRFQARDYDITANSLNIHGSYPINQFVRVGVHYRLEDTDVSLPPSAAPALMRAANLSGLISATGVSLIYDSRNHPLEPTNGFYSRLAGEYAGLGGKHCYFKTSYLNSLYTPLHKSGTLKIRGDAQFLFPFGSTNPNTLPLDSRFYLGGEDSVRGYRQSMVGPLFPASPGEAVPNDPAGGVSSLLFSTEYRYKFNEYLSLFVFLDGGTLSLSELSTGVWVASGGYGARLKIIDQFPPIIVGMGYPINEKQTQRVNKLFFTLGGRF